MVLASRSGETEGLVNPGENLVQEGTARGLTAAGYSKHLQTNECSSEHHLEKGL